ncbi:hypothetical protein EVAR_73221_1 [Eumeta japonica]|uniref:Uncharacterized protein n=1 Tax=Eumeta variegata TaxID=151549 RepID=A0A4C1T3M2_EUMVA|nr:hypothetical protein EVAR_73221_1 [Eumeta japonica]
MSCRGTHGGWRVVGRRKRAHVRDHNNPRATFATCSKRARAFGHKQTICDITQSYTNGHRYTGPEPESRIGQRSGS